MNIFYLSNDTDECAKLHVDKHVVKMILETAQLLSNAHHMLDGDQVIKPIYKLTHKNHPSAVWTRASKEHYDWLWHLLYSLCKEYTHRYDKVHKVEREGLINILKHAPTNIKSCGWLSDPTPAMPDEYKTGDAIQSYKNYYKGAKSSFARWTNRPMPEWFTE
jgi:hypothetical protein